MADIIHAININSDNFSRLKTYLDTNTEYLLFSTSTGASLKVDLKQEKEKSDGAKNAVVRWMNDIKGKTTNYTDYTSAAKRLGEIKSYCDAVIIAATSK